MTGGLARRATFVKKFIAQQPNTILVDSGGLAYIKDQLAPMLDLYNKLNYAAIGIGLPDLRLGEDFWEVAKEKKAPIVQIDAESHNYEQPFIIKEIDGVKIGIISFGCVSPQANEFTLLRKRYSAYQEARAKSDIMIVLDQAQVITDEWLERNAKRFGAPDIVIGGSAHAFLTAPKQIGRTMICPTSTQGTSVGAVKIEYTPGQDPKMTFERNLMDDEVEPDQEFVKFIEGYKEQQRQKVAAVSSHTSVPNPNIVSAQPANGTYYESTMCRTCHASQYDSWQLDSHSKALQTLIRESKVMPECLPCHSEMYRKTSRVINDANKPQGVECASCHASILPHGASFRSNGPTAEDRKVCLTCHTKERSPNFDLATYWERARHKK